MGADGGSCRWWFDYSFFLFLYTLFSILINGRTATSNNKDRLAFQHKETKYWLKQQRTKTFFLKFISIFQFSSVQFSSVAQSCPSLCDPMSHSTPGLPVHHQLPEFTQTHAHWISDAIQPSHPLLSPPLPTFNLSQHQGLFQWVNPLPHVAKVLEFQLQHQSFQWTPRTDLL